ncbi:carboxypeptidase-like regulatory domain-containing protein [Filimonas lacunae]|nr:carboxypeptidase-like regulatory domain-containing protein [Filimonas lacunae]BAV06000.1 RTX toxins and related Ca2+-binding proteins [Filimonas lacunae]
MKTTRILGAACLFAVLACMGCKKSSSPTVEPPLPYTPEPVTATISGRVIDENKLPVSGAVVTAGSVSDTTGVDGLFIINNASVDKNAGFVKVVKDSFYLGAKTIVVRSGKDNNVSIQLIKKTVAGTFAASSGGTVTVPASGGNIQFQAGSVVNAASNAAYTGNVSVSAFFFDPTAEGFDNIIPGTLRGTTTNNIETGLQSFSMMAVELTGDNGEKLQLADGKPATITFAIPADIRSKAPNNIPLWYLDETSGLWKEEGEATRKGDTYVGTVKHFSYWNCDAPFAVIDFSATITDKNGIALKGGKVVFTTSDSTVNYGAGNINDDGFTGGKIPAMAILTMIIYDKCGSQVYRKSVGPFAGATPLGTIVVDATTTAVTISGSVVNCSGGAVADGYVTVELENVFYRTNITNGSFSLLVNRCNNTPVTATVTAYDPASAQSGEAAKVAVSGTSVNAGVITVCGTVYDQYVYYTVNGQNYGITAPPFNMKVTASIYGYGNGVYDTVTELRATSAENEYRYFYLAFRGGAYPGVKAWSGFYPYDNSDTYFVQKGNADVIVTEYGSTGTGYIVGSFTGNVSDSNNNSKVYPISCRFRLKR